MDESLRVIPVSGDVVMRAVPKPFDWAPGAAERIESIWSEEKARRGDRLYDAALLRYLDFADGVLTGAYATYKEFVAVRRDPSLLAAGRFQSVGVSGAARCAAGYFFARRSSGVTNYPGRWEFVPSGGVDDARRGPDGTIDYRGLLADELLEETGFGPERVLAAEPFALIYDGADDTWDLCMTIDLDLTEAEARAHLNRWRPGEYAELVLVAHADLRDFLRSHRSDLIPTARGMARVLDLAP